MPQKPEKPPKWVGRPLTTDHTNEAACNSDRVSWVGLELPIAQIAYTQQLWSCPVQLLVGVPDSPTDKRFANSAPAYMGITRRILAGYKGVHPNA